MEKRKPKPKLSTQKEEAKPSASKALEPVVESTPPVAEEKAARDPVKATQ